MSKSKSSSKSAKQDKTDILTKVKDAAITKPAQTIKAKSKELAKQVAGKEEKKEKKSKKKTKEPTPEPSESEDSESSESSSESESEAEVAKPAAPAKTNGATKVAAKDDSSDESESDDESSASEAEAPKANGTSKKAVVVKPKAQPKESSDESESESGSEEDSADDSSDESSEDEKPAKKDESKTTKSEAKMTEREASAESDADSSGSESESSEDSDAEEEDEEEVPAKPTKRKAEEDPAQTAKKSKTETLDTSKGANLFVGNLSWNVDEAWLREVFEAHGELSGVRLMTDRNTGRSKGFGYVEFVNAEDAAKAHKEKAGFELDGRALNVDFANARPDNSQKQENRRKSYGDQVSEPSDTLFLGNLSFEVGQETVTEAFAPHGTILGIRLPTDRETGQPKGFGYVTFSSIDEAKAALEAMQGEYIENRPVRLDYSSPRPQNSDSPARGRGGFGGRGAPRGGRGGRGGSFGGRGGRGGGRGGSTNRGGFGDFSGRKTSFD